MAAAKRRKPTESKLDVVYLPIEKVVPYKNNPRSNDLAVESVKRSLRTFGWRQPIVIDKSNVVIVGHTRLLAARDLGMDRVPVHVARNLTEKQVRAYRLADNKTGEIAEWNVSLLMTELQDLQDQGLDLGITGFSDAELANLLSTAEELDLENLWKGMPEFTQDDASAFRTVKIHFQDQKAVDNFVKLTGFSWTDKTKYCWFPPLAPEKSTRTRSVK